MLLCGKNAAFFTLNPYICSIINKRNCMKEITTTAAAADMQRVKRLYLKKLNHLTKMACVAPRFSAFRDALREDILARTTKRNKKDADRLLNLLDYDGQRITELSTGKEIKIDTIKQLWLFLRSDAKCCANFDFLTDVYNLLCLFYRPQDSEPLSLKQLNMFINKWPTGICKVVSKEQEANKKRIIEVLIHKIENRTAVHSPYRFDKKVSWAKKYIQVRHWWTDYRFQLSMAARTPEEINAYLGHSLSEKVLNTLAKARQKKMPFFATPYYLSLLDVNHIYDDAAIRSYVIYSDELVDTFGDIRAWEREDIVEDGKPNAAGWLLPDGNNIHRRYPDVAILIPDSIGRACGGLCASCQRMYDFQSGRLNFNFDALKPKEQWGQKLQRLMQYFENDSQLRDILITGGDALMSRNQTLKTILEAVYDMAKRKREANIQRKDGYKYAELQRVRLGSRLPVYLPMRITNELTDILADFKKKAAEIGVEQFYIQTHFQSPLELTTDSLHAIKLLQEAGWTVTNQMVFTAAASRRGHAAGLRKALTEAGVVPYYTFTVKGFNENYAVYAPNARSMQEANEEKRLTGGSDRNVLNLPGIGKSMTFCTVGIMPDGRRILKFEHDHSRKHSPIIEKMGDVFIAENKSINAYLNQLKGMGEPIGNYSSIWGYTEGVTEPRNPLYEYPLSSLSITREITNSSFASGF
jgi:lysine 2,3-aminomutase